MIADWITIINKTKKFKSFQLINADEKLIPTKEIIEYLGKEVLASYREVDHLARSYKSEPEQKLKDYLLNMVFPPKVDRFNVRQGDFGETIARLFIEKFTPLKVPCYKLRHKFNNTKSVFCTDIFAHNEGTDIKELKYYEVKTKTNKLKSTININGKDVRKHIGVVAYDGLSKDESKTSNEFVADFIKRLHERDAVALENAGQVDAAEKYWEIAKKYNDIVQNPKNYARSFELILIIEKDQYLDEIIKELIALPPTLHPLDVTIILITGIKNLVDICFNEALQTAVKKVYAK